MDLSKFLSVCVLTQPPSLSPFQFLCTDPAKYDRAAPSKQNVLCNGRSALEVIASHADFAAVADEEDNKNISDFAEKIR